jgi:hypothetical protein
VVTFGKIISIYVTTDDKVWFSFLKYSCFLVQEEFKLNCGSSVYRQGMYVREFTFQLNSILCPIHYSDVLYLMIKFWILFEKDYRFFFYQLLSTVARTYSVTVYIKLYDLSCFPGKLDALRSTSVSSAADKLKLSRNIPDTIQYIYMGIKILIGVMKQKNNM